MSDSIRSNSNFVHGMQTTDWNDPAYKRPLQLQSAADQVGLIMRTVREVEEITQTIKEVAEVVDRKLAKKFTTADGKLTAAVDQLHSVICQLAANTNTERKS